jgi:hypothetical protein
MATATTIVILGMANLAIEITIMHGMICIRRFYSHMAIFTFGQLRISVSLFNGSAITMKLGAAVAIQAFKPTI